MNLASILLRHATARPNHPAIIEGEVTLGHAAAAGRIARYAAHLARHGIPCPAPIADLSDQYLRALNGKPAALVTRLLVRRIAFPGKRIGAGLGVGRRRGGARVGAARRFVAVAHGFAPNQH